MGLPRIATLTEAKKDITYYFGIAANRFFPRYFKRPYPKDRLAEILSTDYEDNVRSKPPEDESVGLCSMWVIEFYTPSYMNGLFDSLGRLGWNDDDHSRNPTSLLKSHTAIQFGHRRIPLGPILPRNSSETRIVESLRADLPSDVKYVNGDIHCLTPSLISIVLEFVFDETLSTAYDTALRLDRKSYVTPAADGYRIHSPENQKADHVDQIRKQAAEIASGWITNNMPGIFSSGLLKGDFPTCEFVTLRKATPFPSPTELDETATGYLSKLGLGSSFDAWESAIQPRLRFDPTRRKRLGKHHGILSLNESIWLQGNPGRDTNHDRNSRLNRLHERINGIVGIWAVLSLLQGYADHFEELRRSALFGHQKDGQIIKALQEISESISFSVDISAVTSELSSYFDRRIPLGIHFETFTPCFDAGREATLRGRIQNEIGEYSKLLRTTDGLLRGQMTQYGGLLGTLKDIRLQNRVTFLTIVLTILTVVLALLTIEQAFDSPWLKLWDLTTTVVRLLITRADG